MNKIHQLPDHIVAKIAAGEVIERPAYVVKELIENAIDAGADLIEVTMEDAGLRNITVRDNGEGMSEEDLKLSFLPHTTSKLSEDDELIGIKTLGFRGEALSSIAAVADFSIQSRRHDASSGTIVKVSNGSFIEASPIGMPKGSIITVENLFLSVPARKKFLKTKKTEFRLSTDIVIYYALSYHTIHFTLTHNKKVILDLPKKDSIDDRLIPLFGESIKNNLIPFSHEEGYIKLKGFIGKPQNALRQNQKQYVFINNRYITDRMISTAVRESYGTLLPASSTPIFLLHITLPYEIVDINVHPRKEQVSFHNAPELFSVIKQVVAQTLSQNNLLFNFAKFKQDTSAKTSETTSIAGLLLKETILNPEKQGEGVLIKNAPFIQVEKTYILSVAKKGVLVIDQHAAHERILYEKYLKAFNEKRTEKELYEFKKLRTVHLSISDAQLLEDSLSIFSKLGFSIESFGRNTFVIRAIPNVFAGRNIDKILQDMLIDLSEEKTVSSIDIRTQRMLLFLSCRGAVKAGERLTEKQMKELIKQLEKADNNATCPHGRPTRIVVSSRELQRLFKR